MPHNGCPHQCTFCNQVNITGSQSQPTAADVEKAIKTAVESGVDCSKTEIAFFGGSFTAINRDYMIELLNATKKYIDKFYGIRCSTRPDAIDDEILKLLKDYSVTSIELGAQSMCDDVLLINERGHTSEDVINSAKLIKKYGISLGLQMMTGLYGSTVEKDIYTARKIAELKPDTVRVYPTITLEGTKLAELYRSGEYVPYNEEQTIYSCTEILRYFTKKNITVIRLGLHYSEDIINNKVAGYYHPAFREICESRIFFDKIFAELKNYQKGSYIISVAKSSLSKAVGQKKCNTEKLKNNGYNIKFVANDELKTFDFIINT